MRRLLSNRHYSNCGEDRKPSPRLSSLDTPGIASGYIFEVSSSTMNSINYINNKKECTIFLKITT